MKLYRQGDWVFAEVGKVPEEAKPEKRDSRNRLIIGEGEATGHAHAVHSKEADIMVLDNVRWLLAPEAVDVVHEEHDTIRLPAGTYELRPQFIYERGQIRKVLD